MTVVRHGWTQVVGAAAVVFTVCAGLSAVAAQDAKVEAQGAQAGPGIWGGVYTDDQAKRGEAASNRLCTSCHGPDLSGGEAGPTLAGLEFIGNWTALSVGDFFDRVLATMPADAPGTMTPQQTSDITAYVLKLNKYPAGQAELATDVSALKQIIIDGQPPAK